MTRPGPAPKPTALRKLQGNPGKRGLNRNEPKPDADSIDKPYGLATHHKHVAKLWDELAPELQQLGILTNIDTMAFRLMLHHYDLAIQAVNQVQREGLTRRDENNVERKNPALQIFRDNSAAYRRYAAEFGVTPSSRSRLDVQQGAEQLALGDILVQAIFNAEANEG